MYISLCYTYSTESEQREKFICEELETSRGSAHTIRRTFIYEDMIHLYNDPRVICEHPFRIKFEGEKGVDTGGLTRDAFSAFWEEAYLRHFDGSSVLAPTVHAGLDISLLHTLGRILSHGYLACGYLPVRIAFPTLAAILLGADVIITADILLDTFREGLTPVDQSAIALAISSKAPFTQDLTSKLVDIFSRVDCLEMPTPSNVLKLCQRTASYLYIQRPCAAINEFRKGIPHKYHPFWSAKGVSGLYRLYIALTATPSKVLETLEEPITASVGEQRVFTYLQQFIGHMKIEEVQKFLRFITGSSVCISQSIKVTFNSLSGLARRPISHTCTSTLELSTSYVSYLDFSTEFSSVLSQEAFCWKMDAM